VLIVDQGASFGGSAIVAAAIANRMPADRYEIHMAAAIPPSFLRLEPSAAGRVRQIAKPFSYLDQARRRGQRSRLPRNIRRMKGWMDLGHRLARNAGYTRAVARWINQENISILHLNNGFENLEAHLAGRLTGCGLVFHAHGPCGTARLTRWLARRAQHCIAISQPVASSLRSAGVADVTVMPNPLTVDSVMLDPQERWETRRAYGVPPGALTLGSVGRIVPWKGQLEFLRAAAVAMQQVPEAVAVVIGDVTDDSQSYGETLREEVHRLGIRDRVIFTGFIQDPRKAYALVDVLVHSSIQPEPFGLVLTEAMALGIPVVASASGGPREILNDGVDGFLRDPLDAVNVGSLLVSLLTDADLRQRIACAGRETATSRFSVDRYVARLADFYDAALKRAGKATGG
jgi:glycosyltransferase involved in cell wall biosynthesis